MPANPPTEKVNKATQTPMKANHDEDSAGVVDGSHASRAEQANLDGADGGKMEMSEKKLAEKALLAGDKDSQKEEVSTKTNDRDKTPFVVTIHYEPKKHPHLILEYRRPSASINSKFESSEQMNQILDDCLEAFIRGKIADDFKVSLPEDPRGDERHDAGRIRREASRVRRLLQSYSGEDLSDEDEDEDEKAYTQPFNTEASLSINLGEHKVKLEMCITTERYGDICASAFRDAMLSPVQEMMKKSGVENPFQDDNTLVVQMIGLRVPGLREYLAKELHNMKVEVEIKNCIIGKELPDGVVDRVASLSLSQPSMGDIPHEEHHDGRVLTLGTDGKVFAALVEKTASRKVYNEFVGAEAIAGFSELSTGALVYGLMDSDDDDYFTDQDFDY